MLVTSKLDDIWRAFIFKNIKIGLEFLKNVGSSFIYLPWYFSLPWKREKSHKTSTME